MQGLIDKYSASVGMKQYLDKEPSNLSGGQKQRVAIASILALMSKVLILDEATTMLDPAGKEDINNLIDNVKYKVEEFTGLEIEKINIYVEGVRVID